MSAITAPFRFVGRVSLWILFFPLGMWRSYVNHSRKKERRRMKFEAQQRAREGS